MVVDAAGFARGGGGAADAQCAQGAVEPAARFGAVMGWRES
jgi:hypothetical protein